MTIPALLSLALQVAPATTPAEARTVTVSVTDEKGGPVTGLRPEEVAVLENGVARDVSRLEPETRPLTVAVIVDSSEPIASFYRLSIVDAVVRFLGRLPEGARYSLWTTGDRPTKVVDFTDDVARAGPALKRTFPRGGNTVLDAIVEASEDLKLREGQRTAVVVVSGNGLGLGCRFLAIRVNRTGPLRQPGQPSFDGARLAVPCAVAPRDASQRQEGPAKFVTLSPARLPSKKSFRNFAEMRAWQPRGPRLKLSEI